MTGAAATSPSAGADPQPTGAAAGAGAGAGAQRTTAPKRARPQPAAHPHPAARPQPAAVPGLAARLHAASRLHTAARPQPAAVPGLAARLHAAARLHTAARPDTAAARALVAAVVLGAALLAGVALLGGGSAPAPVEPGIVPLRVSSGNGIATGFAVADGRVITVSHVLDGPVTVGGRRVRVLRVDHRNDLALLAAPGQPGHAPSITSAANGEHLRVIRIRRDGLSSLSVHARRSIVAHVRAAGAARAVVRPALELSARIAPGDSGAAVVSDGGALAGVLFAASRNRSDTAYAVDASAVRHLLARP
jgi:hypothetical protein